MADKPQKEAKVFVAKKRSMTREEKIGKLHSDTRDYVRAIAARREHAAKQAGSTAA